MKMKRFLSMILAFTMAVSMVGCAAADKTEEKKETEAVVEQTTEEKEPSAEEEQDAPAKKTEINIAALKGPTAFGLLDLMEKNDRQETANSYNFTLAGAPDELVGKIVSGELDIAAVPTNLASVLYNKTEGGVQLAALNTMGVLYILENGDSIQSAADLEGKTIYATGKGSTPEYALNLVLEKNGLVPGENVAIEYKDEHAEIAPLLASGEAQIALLPQPFVTSVLTQNDKVRVALDMTEEWDKAVDGQSGLTMGCVVVRKEFAQNNKEALDAFLEEYSSSVEIVNSEDTLDHSAQLAEQYDIINAAVAKKAIPECNIVFVEGEQMQKTAGGFLQVLFDADPKAVGGKLPSDDFYYKR